MRWRKTVSESAWNAGLAFQRSAAHGDLDGANNFDFWLEHVRGVKQNIKAAAECSKFAGERGHPEGAPNYRRCLQILGHWKSPNRSSAISDSSL
jgi:TPR repeat protein